MKLKKVLFFCTLTTFAVTGILFLNIGVNTVASAGSNAWAGQGTSGDPFRIYDRVELEHLAQRVNIHGDNFATQYFRLMTHIDLSTSPWTAIGTQNLPFSGTFNGNGFTITLPSTLNAIVEGAALFGVFGSVVDANISNLIVEGNITTWTTDIAGLQQFRASVAGRAVNSTFVNVTNRANQIMISPMNVHVGGIIGIATNTTLINVANYGNVVAGSVQTIGGLVATIIGQNNQIGVKIINSYNKGNIQTQFINSNFHANIIGEMSINETIVVLDNVFNLGTNTGAYQIIGNCTFARGDIIVTSVFGLEGAAIFPSLVTWDFDFVSYGTANLVRDIIWSVGTGEGSLLEQLNARRNQLPVDYINIASTWVTSDSPTFPRHTVSFVWNNQTVSVQNIQHIHGRVLLPTPPTRTGFTFYGWENELIPGVRVDDWINMEITGSITFNTMWTANAGIVAFESGHASVTGSVPNQITYSTGESLPLNVVHALVRPGFNFTGFYHNGVQIFDENGGRVADNYFVIANAGDTITLTAGWVGYATFTIQFYSQDVRVHTSTILIGETVTAHVINRDGYTLSHWESAQGVRIDFPLVVGENLTIHAVWIVDENFTPYPPEYKPNGYNGDESNWVQIMVTIIIIVVAGGAIASVVIIGKKRGW
ncbi:MAG: InlB B-repeat-containing protein [Firmicutes bacterium]|nr:InlB B-repeat-containing protein [Bacillota bacterium]